MNYQLSTDIKNILKSNNVNFKIKLDVQTFLLNNTDILINLFQSAFCQQNIRDTKFIYQFLQDHPKYGQDPLFKELQRPPTVYQMMYIIAWAMYSISKNIDISLLQWFACNYTPFYRYGISRQTILTILNFIVRDQDLIVPDSKQNKTPTLVAMLLTQMKPIAQDYARSNLIPNESVVNCETCKSEQKQVTLKCNHQICSRCLDQQIESHQYICTVCQVHIQKIGVMYIVESI